MIPAVQATVPTTAARRALLAGLIDHAALFPPASMSLEDALAEDRRLRASPEAWMVGRFICPASRLEALVDAAGGVKRLPALSVVLDGDPHEDLRTAAGSGARVELVELRSEQPQGLRAAVDAALGGEHVAVYVEGVDPGALGQGLGAKIRCGGASAGAFPPPEAVAAFVCACVHAGVPFKATAGLHHPIRHVDVATGFHMHGFLNLLAAACAGYAKEAGEQELTALLAEEDPAAVLAALARFDLAAVEGTRAGLLHAYGSCSIAEPVDDLRALGVLPA
jgi:hypothetical protein